MLRKKPKVGCGKCIQTLIIEFGLVALWPYLDIACLPRVKKRRKKNSKI